MVLFSLAAVGAAPPGTPQGGGRSYDVDAHVDANEIDMYVTNFGSFGWDLGTWTAGLIFPRDSGRTSLYAGGLWIFGTIGGDLRAATAEYSFEYGPGRILPDGSWTDPDDPHFRVYKIDGGSGPGDPDYDEWPGEEGAPIDENGDPLLIGEQTLWSIFHDADPAWHDGTPGGSLPLMVEVQHLCYAMDAPGLWGRVVFMEHTVRNAGAFAIEGMMLGLWLDPDIGGPTDDLAGCHRDLQASFSYNGDEWDDQYENQPPALAAVFLDGPGEEPYALVDFVNGTDPFTLQEGHNVIRGLALDGTPVIDPITGEPTRYWHGGDPVTGEGWLNEIPSDCRNLMGIGPVESLEPGSSVHLRTAIVIGQGADRLAGVIQMQEFLRELHALEEDGAFPLPDHWAITRMLPAPFCPEEGETGHSYLIVPQDGDVTVEIIDADGQMVRRLVDGMPVSGPAIVPVVWDGRDDEGVLLPVGAYDLVLLVSEEGRPDHRIVWDRGPAEIGCDRSTTPVWPPPTRESGPGRLSLSVSPVLVSGGWIRLAGSEVERAKILALDTRGRVVRRLDVQSGESVWWDGRSDAGRRLPSGFYFLQARIAGGTVTARTILVR